MNLAVVTIVHGRHRHLAAQHRSLSHGSRLPQHYVVVAMDDPVLADWRPAVPPFPDVVMVDATKDDLPLAGARNRGVARALEAGADDVVLLDVDCLAGPHLVAGYAAALAADPGTVWSGPVTYLPPATAGGYDIAGIERQDDPHPGRPAPRVGDLCPDADPDLFWSLSFAIRASVWREVGGFCAAYAGYGAEDTDFGRLVVRSGHRLGWAGTPRAYHQHHDTEDPPTQHLDAILRNGRIFHDRWGDWPMLTWLRGFEERGLVVQEGDGWVRASETPAL